MQDGMVPPGRMPRLPLELHLHLEGTIGPDLLSKLTASRDSGMRREDLADCYEFGDFKGFLDSFRRVVGFLSRPEDFSLVAAAACRKLEKIGVRYAEIIYTPLIHVRRGLEHDAVSGAVFEALRSCRAAGGPRVNLIYDTVRQWGSEAAIESARIAIRDRKAGLPVVGFGVGGDELSVPARELRKAFRLAKEAGLKSYVHAGEVGGPDSVREALEVLDADRIGHGLAAVRDPLLMQELVERGVALDCCPTSNLLTGAVKSMKEHPLPVFLERGVPVTLGSDDPGFFGVWLDRELEGCIARWGWGAEQVKRLTRNAVDAAFLPDEEKAVLRRSLADTD